MMKYFLLLFIPLILSGISLAQDHETGKIKQQEPASPIVQSVNKLGEDMLLYQLKENPKCNHCVCPLPIASITAALAEGAAGETKNQLLKPFPKISDPLQELQSINKSIAQQNVMRFLDFFTNAKSPLKDSFRKKMEETHALTLHPVNTDDQGIEAIRNSINRIIARQTQNKFLDFISPDMISPEFALIITDVVAMNSKWKSPFSAQATKVRSFFPGKKIPPVKVKTMNETTSKFVLYEGHSLFWKDYENSCLRMIAVLPAIGMEVAQFMDSSSPEEWLKLTLNSERIYNYNDFEKLFEKGLANVFFPKFSVMTPALSLKSFMESQGINECFIKEKADLSGMIGKNNLNSWYVSDIYQKTFIQMNEKRTIAYAASGADVDPFCGTPEIKATIRFNRPFVYCIIDTKTKAVLFLGVINNPFLK